MVAAGRRRRLAARQGPTTAAEDPLIDGRDLDVVIPSAHGNALLERTLPALAAAVDRAGVPRDRVVLCDDAPAPRAEVRDVVSALGFRWLPTHGVGAGPARNAGASSGSAELILFLDDDVLLDEAAVSAVVAEVRRVPDVTAIVGGLRPPDGGPAWWEWTYADATLTPAAASAGDAELPPHAIGTGLVAIRRGAFESVGGFPDVRGIEDALFGLRLESSGAESCRVIRRTSISGVHLFEPTWDEWLRRSVEAGARLRAVSPGLDPLHARRLVAAHRLDASLRGRVKRTLGYLPLRVLRLGRGRLGRRLAAAGAEARGWRLGAGAAP